MVLSTKTKEALPKKSETKPDPAQAPDKSHAASSPFRRFPHFYGIIVTIALGSAVLGFWLGLSRPWYSLTYRTMSPEQLAALPDDAKPMKPGPWGNMESMPIYIEPPEEYLPVQSIEQADRRWRFTGFTVAQLTEFFQNADLTDEQRDELLEASKWDQGQGAIYVNPSKALLLSLSPRARKQIYAPLTTDPDNIFSFLRCSYPSDKFDSYLSHSGLSDETIALVKQLSFPYGHLVFFCDIPLVLDTLKTYDQKVRLLKTLLRKSTLLLRLHITPNSDINELEHYWVRAGWGVDTRPMLESLAQAPGGARLDVVELFPPIPSANIYTFPYPSLKPEDLRKDCAWTALNFFRDVPDSRFTDSATVRQTLLTDYYPVLSDPRYGDIVILTKANGDFIHAAVFIADNVVYTKNSPNFRDPFILMTLSDLLDHFSSQIPEDQTLQVAYYRNKYY